MAKLTGYAARFNSESVPIGGAFIEIIKPGAFARSLREGRPILALYNHESGELLGRSPGSDMVLGEDRNGLYFELSLPDTQRARDAYKLVAGRILQGMSFGFTVPSEDGEFWYMDSRNRIVRELLEVDLMEISLTGFPAYPETSVEARASADGRLNRMRRRYMKTRLAASAA